MKLKCSSNMPEIPMKLRRGPTSIAIVGEDDEESEEALRRSRNHRAPENNGSSPRLTLARTPPRRFRRAAVHSVPLRPHSTRLRRGPCLTPPPLVSPQHRSPFTAPRTDHAQIEED